MIKLSLQTNNDREAANKWLADFKKSFIEAIKEMGFKERPDTTEYYHRKLGVITAYNNMTGNPAEIYGIGESVSQPTIEFMVRYKGKYVPLTHYKVLNELKGQLEAKIYEPNYVNAGYILHPEVHEYVAAIKVLGEFVSKSKANYRSNRQQKYNPYKFLEPTFYNGVGIDVHANYGILRSCRVDRVVTLRDDGVLSDAIEANGADCWFLIFGEGVGVLGTMGYSARSVKLLTNGEVYYPVQTAGKVLRLFKEPPNDEYLVKFTTLDKKLIDMAISRFLKR